MKQTNLQTKGESPNEFEFKTITRENSTLTGIQCYSGSPGIFPDQYIGKDPPYRRPCPGMDWCLIPDNKGAAIKGNTIIIKNTLSNHSKSAFKFFSSINFSVMKTQIFIPALFALAASASVTTSYGQAVQGSLPKPLTCVGSALTPFAGRPYDYAAEFNPDGGTAFWYATKSMNIVTGSARTASVEAVAGTVVSAATNYAANQTPTSGPSTTSITWNSAGLSTVTPAAPLLVVVEYVAPASGCANNLKVYNIIPKNGFTVDIRSMASDGTAPADYGTKTEQCVDDIESATYNPATTSMNMDYGDQTLYFEVIAANFTGSFTPSFQLTGLAAGQTAELFWGLTAATATTSLGAIVNTTAIDGTSVTTVLTDTQAGVSIFAKVVIQNNKVENLAVQTITLAVDAVNAQSQKDVLESDCTDNLAFADAASQDIKARPTVTPVAPSTFVVQN